jgi:hypothetical protein
VGKVKKTGKVKNKKAGIPLVGGPGLFLFLWSGRVFFLGQGNKFYWNMGKAL